MYRCTSKTKENKRCKNKVRGKTKKCYRHSKQKGGVYLQNNSEYDLQNIGNKIMQTLIDCKKFTNIERQFTIENEKKMLLPICTFKFQGKGTLILFYSYETGEYIFQVKDTRMTYTYLPTCEELMQNLREMML